MIPDGLTVLCFQKSTTLSIGGSVASLVGHRAGLSSIHGANLGSCTIYLEPRCTKMKAWRSGRKITLDKSSLGIMCPTACSTIPDPPIRSISTVAVALEDSFEISKEPFGAFPFTPKPEIKHHRPVGSTVLPEISLAVLSSARIHQKPFGAFYEGTSN